MSVECMNIITITTANTAWLNTFENTIKDCDTLWIELLDQSDANHRFLEVPSIVPNKDKDDNKLVVRVDTKNTPMCIDPEDISDDVPTDATITIEYEEWANGGFIGKYKYHADEELEWILEACDFFGEPVEVASNPEAVECLEIDLDDWFDTDGRAYRQIERELEDDDIEDLEYNLANAHILDAVVRASKRIYNQWEFNPLESVTGEDDISKISDDDLKVMVKLIAA